MNKIIEAQAAKKGESKITKALKVARTSPVKVGEWFARSSNPTGLLQNVRLERHRINIEVRGACAPDVIFQAFAWQYIDDDRFREAIDEHIRVSRDADTARILAALAQTGASQDVYRLRRELLAEICFNISKGNNKFLRCASEPTHSLAHFFAPLFPSLTSISNCKCRIERKFVTLPFDYDHFKGKPAFEGLQEAIHKRIGSTKKLCKRCGQMISEHHALSDFVFVVVGPPIHYLQDVTDLKGIPLTIKLVDQLYDLRCFIDYKMKGHSKISCLRGDRRWHQYDDNKGEIELDVNESSPYMLIYRRN